MGGDVGGGEDAELGDGWGGGGCRRCGVFLQQGQGNGADFAFGSDFLQLAVQECEAAGGEAIGLVGIPGVELSSDGALFWEVGLRVEV